jgi:hypothetical protein
LAGCIQNSGRATTTAGDETIEEVDGPEDTATFLPRRCWTSRVILDHEFEILSYTDRETDFDPSRGVACFASWNHRRKNLESVLITTEKWGTGWEINRKRQGPLRQKKFRDKLTNL